MHHELTAMHIWAMTRVAVLLAALAFGVLGCAGIPTTPAPPGGPTSGPPTPVPTMPPSSPTSEATPPPGTAAFTGKASDTGYDSDGNGLYEFLRVDVELDVAQGGDFGFTTALTTPDGKLVAVGGLTPDMERTAPVASAALESGRQVISIYFPGSAIRAAGADGPFVASVGLSDAAGTASAAEFTTQAYDHLDFQGPLLEVQGVRDSGVDTDGRPGYDVLRVTADINLLAAGEVTAEGQLFAGEAFLADVAQVANLAPGAHALELDFPGAGIAASGQDGPYTVYLAFREASYTTDRTHTTAPYSYKEFQLPAAAFTGSIMDAGSDTDGDGIYEHLDVTVEVVATVPGPYTVAGVLQDGTGSRIEAREEKITLAEKPVEVTLRFSGAAIRQHGIDGPYQVVMTLTDAAGNHVMDQKYLTSAYAHSAFEAE